MKQKIVALLTTATVTLSLSSCGIHFRNKKDFPPGLWRTTVVDNANNSQLANAISLQFRALGMEDSNNPTTTFTINSYSLNQSAPSVSDSNSPTTITISGILCYSIQKSHNSKAPYKNCVSASDQHIVDTATTYNPSTKSMYGQQLNTNLIATLLQQLQNKGLWQYFESNNAK